jgi:hypothetical protein
VLLVRGELVASGVTGAFKVFETRSKATVADATSRTWLGPTLESSRDYQPHRVNAPRPTQGSRWLGFILQGFHDG